MIRNIKSRNSVAVMALKALWKIILLSARVIVFFASDDRSKVRYTAGKAQQLYEDGAITGSEYARHIQGD